MLHRYVFVVSDQNLSSLSHYTQNVAREKTDQLWIQEPILTTSLGSIHLLLSGVILQHITPYVPNQISKFSLKFCFNWLIPFFKLIIKFNYNNRKSFKHSKGLGGTYKWHYLIQGYFLPQKCNLLCCMFAIPAKISIQELRLPSSARDLSKQNTYAAPYEGRLGCSKR